MERNPTLGKHREIPPKVSFDNNNHNANRLNCTILPHFYIEPFQLLNSKCTYNKHLYPCPHMQPENFPPPSMSMALFITPKKTTMRLSNNRCKNTLFIVIPKTLKQKSCSVWEYMKSKRLNHVKYFIWMFWFQNGKQNQKLEERYTSPWP